MAIPENRMSTIPVPDIYFFPDDKTHPPLRDHEAGPYALNDSSGGQTYQEWILTWDDITEDFTLTPQLTGSPIVVLNAAGVIQIGIAFDQNGRETICYNTLTNSYLYWWDSSIPGFITTDYGIDVFSMALTMDDKRDRQTQLNDIILWYTKAGSARYDLYSRIQRERYTVGTLMATDKPKYIVQLGMHKGYRVQVGMSNVLSYWA